MENIGALLLCLFLALLLFGCSKTDNTIQNIITNKNITASDGFPKQITSQTEIKCVNDDDCVPESCCHSTSCSNKVNAPSCKNIMCSQECAKNTLDCGQARCVCLSNTCVVSG